MPPPKLPAELSSKVQPASVGDEDQLSIPPPWSAELPVKAQSVSIGEEPP